MTIPAERLDQIAHRFAELEARMASPAMPMKKEEWMLKRVQHDGLRES